MLNLTSGVLGFAVMYIFTAILQKYGYFFKTASLINAYLLCQYQFEFG